VFANCCLHFYLPAGGVNGNKRNNKNKQRSARKDVNVVNGGDADSAPTEVVDQAAPVARQSPVFVAAEERKPQHTPRQKYQPDNAADQPPNSYGQGHPNGQHISDKERKIRSVAKKLSDIKKLKVRRSQGENLELNQLNKIKMEAQYLDELKALKQSA